MSSMIKRGPDPTREARGSKQKTENDILAAQGAFGSYRDGAMISAGKMQSAAVFADQCTTRQRTEQRIMSNMELTTIGEGLPLALVTAVQMWADARTDASSSRRKDLIRDKTSAVGDFFSFTGKPPGEVTEIDVKLWQASLEGRGLATRTVYARISRLSSFYRWAMQNPAMAEKIHRKPVSMARPKAPKPYQSESCKSLDDDQVRALMSVVEGKTEFDIVGRRDYCILLWLFTSGWRSSEVLGLKWSDVQINGSGMVVNTQRKGGDYERAEVNTPGPREMGGRRTRPREMTPLV